MQQALGLSSQESQALVDGHLNVTTAQDVSSSSCAECAMPPWQVHCEAKQWRQQQGEAHHITMTCPLSFIVEWWVFFTCGNHSMSHTTCSGGLQDNFGHSLKCTYIRGHRCFLHFTLNEIRPRWLGIEPATSSLTSQHPLSHHGGSPSPSTHDRTLRSH